MQIPDFKSARVLVIGDVMLDRYWSGSTLRISPEAPVPVVRIKTHEDRLGGAANVAANIAALGAQVGLIGVTGDDADADLLTQTLESAAINAHLLRLDDQQTTVKLRVMSRHQQLIRLDFEQPNTTANPTQLLTALKAQLADYDLVVLSDYAKGTLADPAGLIQYIRAAGKPVLVDPKGQNFSRYAGATLLTPNRSEFEAIVGDCVDDNTLTEKASALRTELQLDALLVTRGEEGMTLLSHQPPFHLRAQAQEVFDVTGAGDTVIATLAAALAAKAELPQAVTLANLAASVVVMKSGTAKVSATELRRAAHRRWGSPNGVISRDDLLPLVTTARANGERIVMTNGCFDLLHPGHVAYLEHAKTLGDRLIVAVNSDDSVRRLKGESRPIVNVEDRMAVLAGLASVDWVVPFADDTPAALIADIGPDVLVKGGDYQPEQIAGFDTVTARGGDVVVLEFVAGKSTSAMVKKIVTNTSTAASSTAS